MKEPLSRRSDFLLGAVVFVGALALYWHTLAPSVATIFDDSLEFQVVCPTLGIAHPTGYPLYTLLGQFFTLIPLGDAAYRVNWMSAFFAALTVVFIYLIVRMLTGHAPSAFLASVALAVSPIFWSQAIIAEVYSLNAFFTALVVYLLLRWEAERLSLNHLWPAAFSYGLSLTHHRQMLLLAPAVILFFLLTVHSLCSWRICNPPPLKPILRLILLFLAPLLLYVYIPLRGLYTSSLDGTYHNTWSGFLHHITASGYNVFITGNPLAQSRPLSFYWQLLVSQFGLVGVALSLVGLLALVRKPRPFVLLAVAFACNVAFVLSYRVADVEVFAIPAFLLYVIWIGSGVDFLGQALARVAKTFVRYRLLLIALLLLQPLALLRDNYPRLDLSQHWAVHDYGVDMLSQPLENNAVIIGILGEMTLLRYFQWTEGLRPDVITIPADRDEERLAAIESALAADQAVYITRPVHGLPERYSLSALGPLIRVRAVPVTTAPIPQHPLTVDLTDALRLTGYDTAIMSPHRQTTLRLTLHWQVLALVGADYKVSARLLDGEGNQVAQTDNVPVHNTYPTSRWKMGEIIADVYDLAIPPATPPGPYRLLVILYEPDTLAEVGRAELGTLDDSHLMSPELDK